MEISSSSLLRAGVGFAVLTGIALASSAADVQQVSAQEVLRRVVNQELKAGANDHTRWMFIKKSHKSGKEQEELVVQTPNGDLSRLLSVNGAPISEDQAKKENERIEKLVQNPLEAMRMRRARAQDAHHMEELFRLLPDAMSASYGRRSGKLVEIIFKPNPVFHPRSYEAMVFHHMEGTMWVDTAQNRLAKIEGRLMEDVKFGGGLFGHLNRGGEFRVQQGEVAPGHWEMTLLYINMNGKALFFKTIDVHEDEVRCDFQRVPDQLTLSAAADELRKQTNVKSVGNNGHRQPPTAEVASSKR